MKEKKDQNKISLRQKAEKKIKETATDTHRELSEAEALKLIHEMEVYRIELELQNEELVRSRAEAEDLAEKYTRLYDFAPTGYITLTTKGKIEEINLQGAKLIGKERSLLKNNDFKSYISEDTRPVFDSFFEKIFESQIREKCEIVLLSNNNSTVDLLVSGIASDGKGHCNLTLVDISEQKHYQNEILKQKTFLENISETSPIGIVRLNKVGQIEFANREAEVILGLKKSKLLGSVYNDPIFTILDYYGNSFPEEDIPFNQVKTSLKPVRNIRHSLRYSDGRMVHLSVNGTPEISVEGKFDGMLAAISDITEIRKIEHKLAENEKKFRHLYENSPLPQQSLNSDGTIREVNPAWLRALGYKSNEIIGTYFGDILDSKSKQLFKQNFKNFRKKGFVKDVEFTMLCKDGNSIDVSFEGCIGYNADGKFEQTYCAFQDITERKRSETKLKGSENLLRTIAENMPNTFISVINKDLTVGFSSGMEFKRLKLKPETFLGKTIDEVFGKHASTVKKHYLEAFKGKEQEFELFINFQYQIYKVIPLYDSDGSVSRILSVVENITKRKMGEETIRRSEERFRILSSMAPVGIYLTDKEGRCQYTNPEWNRIAGMKQGDSDGDGWQKAIHPDDRDSILSDWSDTVRKELIWNREYRFISSEGKVSWVKGLASPMTDKSGKVSSYIGVIIDITDRKRDEIELIEKTEQLEYANSNFVGREHRMIDLKKEVNELLKKSGQKEKYIIHDSDTY